MTQRGPEGAQAETSCDPGWPRSPAQTGSLPHVLLNMVSACSLLAVQMKSLADVMVAKGLPGLACCSIALPFRLQLNLFYPTPSPIKTNKKPTRKTPKQNRKHPRSEVFSNFLDFDWPGAHQGKIQVILTSCPAKVCRRLKKKPRSVKSLTELLPESN